MVIPEPSEVLEEEAELLASEPEESDEVVLSALAVRPDGSVVPLLVLKEVRGTDADWLDILEYRDGRWLSAAGVLGDNVYFADPPPNDAAFYFDEQTRLDSRKGFEHYKAFLGRRAPTQIIEAAPGAAIAEPFAGSLEDAMNRFTQEASKHWEGTAAGVAPRIVNQTFDNEIAAFRRIWAAWDNGRHEALISLVAHRHPGVRLAAATPLLATDPGRAIPVLEDLARMPGLGGFGAKKVLEEWRKGRLDPLWSVRHKPAG
jgi:hypothetical protein